MNCLLYSVHRIVHVSAYAYFHIDMETLQSTILFFFFFKQGGRGLHSTLNFHSKKFFGILNGIDTDAWNPATDSFLEVQYSANDLQGKAENKSAIRKRLGLLSMDDRQPLVIISEVVHYLASQFKRLSIT